LVAASVMVQVRRAVPHDAAPIGGVHVRAWQVAYRGLMPDEVLDGLSVEQREQMWQQALASQEGQAVYVAVEDAGCRRILRGRSAEP